MSLNFAFKDIELVPHLEEAAADWLTYQFQLANEEGYPDDLMRLGCCLTILAERGAVPDAAAKSANKQAFGIFCDLSRNGHRKAMDMIEAYNEGLIPKPR